MVGEGELILFSNLTRKDGNMYFSTKRSFIYLQIRCRKNIRLFFELDDVTKEMEIFVDSFQIINVHAL